MDKKYKILLIDDNPFFLGLYSVKIKKLGIEVETLEHPTRGFVKTVLQAKPDLISLDIVMPEIDGFEAIQLIKADPRTKDIPVMFATNQGEASDIEKGIALGAVDYIILADVTPNEMAECYAGYLRDPQHYIPRYPTFLEASKKVPISKSFIWKLIKILSITAVIILCTILGIWLIVILGPLWIIAIVLLAIFFFK